MIKTTKVIVKLINGESIDGETMHVWISKTLYNAFESFPVGTKLKMTLEKAD